MRKIYDSVYPVFCTVNVLYSDTMAQIAIAVGILLTNNVKKFMSKILAILAKNLDSWPGSTLSWSRLPRSRPRSIRFFAGTDSQSDRMSVCIDVERTDLVSEVERTDLVCTEVERADLVCTEVERADPV